MKPKERMAIAASVCVLTLLLAGTASAQAENQNTAVRETFRWINFAIVAALLLWLFLKKLPPVFRNKAETIRSAIAKATTTKAEADARLRGAEERLASLEKQIAELRAEAQRESQAEVERIRAMTRSDREKILVAAKAEIEAAERAARMELKQLAAKLAVESAESQLASQLTPSIQEALLSGFLKSLGRPN
jgi:F-type H+-transporting ATPase subunit b